ncbi:MAG: hypothetical protein DI563_01550 [Variovorax paradoxus]|uniref:Uncharacterized protein n=1 Tax=Variovorax paradoxus TaxID=34073 RepID=A0A2W5SF11_VARPD|nr:MAG: hypothetical protein DI563_01550 [Variovorax paradoxus]
MARRSAAVTGSLDGRRPQACSARADLDRKTGVTGWREPASQPTPPCNPNGKRSAQAKGRRREGSKPERPRRLKAVSVWPSHLDGDW